MDPTDLSNISLESSPLLTPDVSNDGSLDISSTDNLSSSDLPDYSPLSTSDIAPLDNVNGSSNISADPTSALNAQFSTPTGFDALINDLTGGANGLANDLSGLIDPTQANTSQSTGGLSTGTILLIGGAAILLILVLK
jgi:hypothetical protein